jgi:hypothetical protein
MGLGRTSEMWTEAVVNDEVREKLMLALGRCDQNGICTLLLVPSRNGRGTRRCLPCEAPRTCNLLVRCIHEMRNSMIHPKLSILIHANYK